MTNEQIKQLLIKFKSVLNNRLYVTYSGEIFTNINIAINYIKRDNLEKFRYISFYEYSGKIKGYQEIYTLYYLDKSSWDKCVRHFWDSFNDKSLISSDDFFSTLDKIEGVIE